MIRRLLAASAAVSVLLISTPGAAIGGEAPPASAVSQEPTPEQIAKAKADFVASLTKRTGQVKLAEPHATLNLGDKYFFLDAKDSRRVLVDAWGNPKDATEGVLGMVFPAGATPLDEGSWGAVLRWSETGYVSDKDARTIKYDELLTKLREGEDQENQQRKKEGFEPIHLVGWAQPPTYEADHHALIWAQDLKFGDQSDDTLNYDVRVLGRKGVLSVNIVSTMSQLPQVRTAATELETVADFDAGSRYADFKEGSDKRAEFGLAGLVLAGAGLAVAKKAGLLAILLVVLKKGFVFIIAGFGAAVAWIRKLLAGRKAA